MKGWRNIKFLSIVSIVIVVAVCLLFTKHSKQINAFHWELRYEDSALKRRGFYRVWSDGETRYRLEVWESEGKIIYLCDLKEGWVYRLNPAYRVGEKHSKNSRMFALISTFCLSTPQEVQRLFRQPEQGVKRVKRWGRIWESWEKGSTVFWLNIQGQIKVPESYFQVPKGYIVKRFPW